jgi:hypothetical protein
MPNFFKIILYIVSPFFWFSLLLSLSLTMFYWRVANEPGAKDTPELTTAAILCFFIGLVGTVVLNYLFMKKNRNGLTYLWIANAIATLIYIPVFLLTLLMMV